MGCSFSRPRDPDSNPRIFKVFNVDDQGQELNAGKIEITESDLVLHQKSKEPIRWPLRSLRRYGFDAELFSFESGRRCPTGPGIYAFKCRRAEALFNLLQECIQRAGQEEQAAANSGQRPSAATTATVDGSAAGSVATNATGSMQATVARPGSLVEIHTPNGSLPATTLGGGGGGSIAGSVASGTGGPLSSAAPSPHHYINGYVVPQSPPHGAPPNQQQQAGVVGGGAPCPCPPSAHTTSVSSSSSPAPQLTSGGVVVVGTVMKTHEYVNTEIAVGAAGASSARAGSHQSLDLSGVQLRMMPSSGGTHRPSVSDAQVINYAELDLPKTSLEELQYGPGSGAAGHLPHHHAGFSIVELDPTSSQATYINVPAADGSTSSSTGTAAALIDKARTLDPCSPTAVIVTSNGTGGGAVRKVLMRQVSKDDPHNYANLDILSSAVGRGGGPPNTSGGSSTEGAIGRGGRKVTYIQVDVRSSKENLYAGGPGANPPASPISLSPSIPDSPRRTESYAQIDFHKTAALSKVANTEDEGSRKTRHNSNIEELN